MNQCIICNWSKPKNQPYRCIKCYTNTDNDKKLDTLLNN